MEEAAGEAGTAKLGARDLFRSTLRFKQLPDYLQIWPSHGAGSACGKGLGAIPSSTVGYEKMFNEALQFDSEDAFVEYILTDQPEAPPYFAIMKHVNKHGPKVIGNEGLPEKLAVAGLADAVERHMVVDLCGSKNFAQEHVPGTINIPTNSIVRDAGWFVDYEKPLYLIVGSEVLSETMRVFREMGIDNIAGYFDDEDVINSGLATESYDSKTPAEVLKQIESGEFVLVDVRRKAEWHGGHVPQARYSFLGRMLEDVSELPNDKPVVFQCHGGARSAVACSIAQARGIENVINLDGGIARWRREGYPMVVDALKPVG